MKKDDPDHQHAQAYFMRFLEDGTRIYSSTIVAAEYGVKDNINHLPVRDVTLLAFDINHARQASDFAKAIFHARKKGVIELENRVLIPNDTKLIAQAQVIQADYFVARDANAENLLTFLQKEGLISCRFLDIASPPNQFFGELF
ncbi:MAG: hypothetical protein R3C61_16445 [Bacteroidia bacterium]